MEPGKKGDNGGFRRSEEVGGTAQRSDGQRPATKGQRSEGSATTRTEQRGGVGRGEATGGGGGRGVAAGVRRRVAQANGVRRGSSAASRRSLAGAALGAVQVQWSAAHSGAAMVCVCAVASYRCLLSLRVRVVSGSTSVGLERGWWSERRDGTEEGESQTKAKAKSLPPPRSERDAQQFDGLKMKRRAETQSDNDKTRAERENTLAMKNRAHQQL